MFHSRRSRLVDCDVGVPAPFATTEPSATAAAIFVVRSGLLQIVHATGLAAEDDAAQAVAACELALEALVARKRISRNEAGEYGRAAAEPRRRPNDLFGGGVG